MLTDGVERKEEDEWIRGNEIGEEKKMQRLPVKQPLGPDFKR